MRYQREDLTPILQELSDSLGMEETLQLMEAFAGQQLQVPFSVEGNPHHPLVKRLGAGLARRVIQLCGGNSIQIPTGRRVRTARAKRMVYQAWLSGNYESYNDLAERSDVTVRTVYNWIRDFKGLNRDNPG